MAKDPNAVAEKWARNLAGSTQDITAGVQGVTVAPGQRAVAQKDAYLQNVMANVDKWARNTGAVTLEEWRSKMLEKGVPRIASGATAAKPKMATFMTSFLPHVEQVAAQVRSMPKVTLEDGIARAVAQMRGNADFKKR